MVKFNKGDRVKALVDGVDYKIGDEFVMTADGDGKSVYFDDNAGDDRMRQQKEFELLPVADNKPPFKVGDRVRLIKDGQSTTGAVGKLATIESWGEKLIDNGQYLLNIDGPVDYQTHAVTPNYTRATPDCFELALQIEAGKYYRTRDGRKVGPMEKWALGGWHVAEGSFSGGLWKSDGTAWYNGSSDSPDLIAEWVDEPITETTPIKSPSIVARIDNGQPMPAARPLVHDTKEGAEKEAKRLSEKHRGKEFGVFTLIAKHQTEAVYDHEWQRLAANGNKIGAIKAIRELTGFGLKAAKDGLEDWLSRNAA